MTSCQVSFASRLQCISVVVGLCLLVAGLAGCANQIDANKSQLRAQRDSHFASQLNAVDTIRALNRITWCVDAQALAAVKKIGLQRYIEQQLQPSTVTLPASVQAQIAAMTITQVPFEQLVQELTQRRKATASIVDDQAKTQARKAYQQELTRLAREAATRSLLRAVYAPNQLQEQMTWFWMNHFSIYQGKRDLRSMVGDYEEQAIRPHVFGKFRDLLAAVVHHPAMLRYLDNEQNAAGHINENYARELMELHTLGVGSGYSQSDVQELARILTGVGINLREQQPNVRPALRAQYVRRGLFEFNPNRHDFGDKKFLGATVHGTGLAELDQALDRLARAPATAHLVSHQLAMFFVSDTPPAALVERMAQTYLRSDGDIAAVLRTLFESSEFLHATPPQFKDPMHYLVSSVRLAYGQKPILNPGPLLFWLNQMGEPLYGRISPDGYPISGEAWNGSGQMTTRFEFARALGAGSIDLFKVDGVPRQRPVPPQLATTPYFKSIMVNLRSSTQQALQQATSPQEWNMLFLSSPEMMQH